MLRYLGTGRRDYAHEPVRSYTRGLWEFQAVVRGRIAPTFGPGRGDALRTRCLWLFGPRCRHGWSAPGGEAEVVVFQFPALPDPLDRAIAEAAWTAVPLDDAAIGELRGLAERAQRAITVGDALSRLCFQHVLHAVAYLVAERLERSRLPRHERSAEEACAAAEAWAAAHLATGADVAGMARAIGVSVSHLRRLFHHARARAPQAALGDLRMRRASELIADGQMSLEAIANACGLSSASALSRAFHRHHGVGPRAWRRRSRPHHRQRD